MANFYKPKKKAQQYHRVIKPQADLAHRQRKLIESILIDRLSDDGRGISHINGKTIFIDGALPGETVSARVVSEKSRFIEGVVEEVLITSPYRAKPKCQYYSLCGGCHVQHMLAHEQHDYKEQTILQQLKRWANIEPESLLPLIVGNEYGYRQRVRLGVLNQSGKVVLGFRKKNSKQLIDVDQCPVMEHSLSCLLTPIRDWLIKYQAAVSHIELIYSESALGVVVRHIRPVDLPIREHLQRSLKPLGADCWYQGKKQADLRNVSGEKVDPRLSYSLKADSEDNSALELNFHPQDFIQGNAYVNQQMVTQAIELLKPQADERFLDLFCGIGNFTLPLSLLAKEVVGIEGVPEMVSRANSNAQINGRKNARFLHADLSSIEESGLYEQRYDGVILDPPRSGANSICENINKLMPKRIVYVSCDSTTFTRDAQLLCNHGYKLESMGVMDMFPQTFHSEIMGLFVHPSWVTEK